MNDIERIKREIPIESLIAQSGLTVTGKGHTLTTVEHDSLKIFTRNNSWTWYSQAGRDGRNLGGSVIDWYKYMHQCGDGEAIRSLSAMLDGGAVPPMPKPRPSERKETPAAWKSPQWQQQARRRLEAAQAALYDDDNASAAAGRAYLTEREIRFDMWVAFGLGFGDAWNIKAECQMPALWLPWMNREITYITARFIGVKKDDPTADRILPAFGMKLQPTDERRYNGERFLFGLQHCREAAPGALETLFLVEGELNAVSIFQCTFGLYAADVLSFGPRSNLLSAGVAPLAAKVAQRYKRVIVWADEPKDALKALGTIPNALPVRSPVIDDKAHDANDLLRAGLLADVVYDLIKAASE